MQTESKEWENKTPRIQVLSNRAAREILEALLKSTLDQSKRFPPSVDHIVFRRDEEGLSASGFPWTADPRQAQRRQEIRDKLVRSDLAARLLDGLDSLPDIYPVLPWPLRELERLQRPKRPAELAKLVLRYLDWYLSPEERVDISIPRSFFLRQAAISLALLLPSLVMCITSPNPDYPLFPLWVLLIGSLLFVVVSYATFLTRGVDHIAAQEFFNYLWQTYSKVDLTPE